MAKTVTHKDLKTYFGDEDHLELSQGLSFSEMVFRLLSERTPTPQELNIFQLILNLSIDHGPETPSAVEVIKAAKEGKTISEAVAAGVLQIDDVHGGAQEQLMEILYKVKNRKAQVEDLIKEYVESGERVPGFGHRIYKEVDPRAQLILKALQEAQIGDEFIEIAHSIEKTLREQTSKQLPLNIDGAIGVALCVFGWESKLGKAVFIIARTPGLCAHFLNNAPQR